MTDALDIQAFAKGVNELLVLAALQHGPRHGYQIALEVESRSGGLFSLQHGTLYPILHRLEREKRIRGTWDDAGGRRRKVYALTAAGRRQLEADAARCHEVFRGLLSVVREGASDAVRSAAQGRRRGA
jgi:DNA-binding PadR family transcriptional regulator